VLLTAVVTAALKLLKDFNGIVMMLVVQLFVCMEKWLAETGGGSECHDHNGAGIHSWQEGEQDANWVWLM
jgi:hypothetical protein